MSFNQSFTGRNKIPGITTAVETFENEFVYGPYEAQYISGIVIDASARDLGNTNNTHILRAGILMGRIRATNKLVPWNPTATDGSEFIWCVLKESISMINNNDFVDRLSGLQFIAGGVYANRLIIPGSTDLGIVGNPLEFLVRQQMHNRFVINDSFERPVNGGGMRTVSADEQANGITLSPEDAGTDFYTDADVTIALGALVPHKGVRFTFTSDGGVITVNSNTANIKVLGVAAANTLTVNNAIRSIEGNGTQWIVS